MADKAPLLFTIRATADWRFEVSIPPCSQLERGGVAEYRALKDALHWPYWFSAREQEPVMIVVVSLGGAIVYLEHVDL